MQMKIASSCLHVHEEFALNLTDGFYTRCQRKGVFLLIQKSTYAVEPLWKGQVCHTKVAKFGPFLRTILYKSCLFYPSFERPPS